MNYVNYLLILRGIEGHCVIKTLVVTRAASKVIHLQRNEDIQASIPHSYFRDMMASSEKSGDVAILTQDHLLKKYVRAHFEVFKVFLKFIVAEKVTQAKGNLFAQLIHGGGTLKFKRSIKVFSLLIRNGVAIMRYARVCAEFDGPNEGVSTLLITGSFYETASVDLSSAAVCRIIFNNNSYFINFTDTIIYNDIML